MRKITLNYPAPIPVGHLVELTWFADQRPARKRDRPDWTIPSAHPAVRDLDTGIAYLNLAHVSAGANGGNPFVPQNLPTTTRSDLEVREIQRGRVASCTLVYLEGLTTQQTVLEVELS